MATTSSTTNADKAKRTRTNVKQSKFGCFTCKYGHTCSSTRAGPRNRADQGLIGLDESSAMRPNQRVDDAPFVDLACTVLTQSPRRARNDLELAFWSRTVPQLTQSIPSVRAAVEAFGSSFEECVLRGGPSSSGLETTRRYTQALRLVQQDLATLPHGPIPCITACLFLAMVEALQQRLDNGHTHLLGALSLLVSHMDQKFLADVDIDIGDVSLLLQKLDLHVATYAVSQSPHLPPSPSITKDVIISDPPDRALFKILHSCYHFTSKAFSYKYTSRRVIPPELLIEQGRQLGNLKQWLSCNKLPSDVDSCAKNESMLVLRSQCLVALIHASNILEPLETAYDCYGPDFQEIVTLIEALPLENGQQKTPDCNGSSSLPSFIPEMGIIHPLYFTAQKYRNPFWRRKALNLLLKSGKEGPWCSETEGSLIGAVIRTEEGLPKKASLNMARLEDASTDDPSNIPEKSRVSACWAVHPEDECEGGCDHAKRFTKAILFRCLDMEGLLRDEGQKPRKLAWEDSKYWELLRESLEAVS
ncbi:hypothetical protein FSARC_2844 [Fusarium sarcochroum]|uniref:Uncharacterized protein n=1 Tax=Fusarium sarcochroum TaxID=1208366 RepID=A0A8H4U5B2_9HYPO|nr:hypothetical protein FSARC_2844 [Fusarium sarcochroum]